MSGSSFEVIREAAVFCQESFHYQILHSMNRRLEKAADLCYSVKMSGIRRETASGRAAGAAKVSGIMI